MGKNKNGLKKYDNVGYFFVLPFVIVFCIFSVYPVLRTLYFSFTNAKIAAVMKIARKTIGIANQKIGRASGRERV